MCPMLLFAVAMLVGFAMLIWSADQIVIGSGGAARNLGISPMLIGLTVVGFATSLPEVIVSATAALAGVPNLAIGNALGSNIANIGLVIGVSAAVRPLAVRSETLRKELPVMLAVCVAPVLLFANLELSRLDGLLLLGGLVLFIWWVARLGLQTRGHDAIEAEYAAELPSDISTGRAMLLIGVGLVVLTAGSNLLVWGSENMARALGVSDLIIGLTLVAIGTSLPELAVSVASARKGETGLALGNIIGSNAFNMLAVVGVAAVLQPTQLEPDAVRLHLPAMLGFTLAFFFIAYNRNETMRVGRSAGALLLGAYLVYLGFVFISIV